jgi:hypothetical protein
MHNPDTTDNLFLINFYSFSLLHFSQNQSYRRWSGDEGAQQSGAPD